MKEEGRPECSGAALFEDPDFPCEDTSLFSHSSTPIARLQGDVTWERPQVRGPGKIGNTAVNSWNALCCHGRDVNSALLYT